MYDAARMGGRKSLGDLKPHVENTIERKPRARACEPLLQRLAVQQFHHDKRIAPLLIHLMNSADIRVVERRGRARLAREPLQKPAIAGQVARKKLNRNITAQPGV